MPTKIKQPKPLSWEPNRVGAIYCAPACGAGCTYTAFKKAQRDAMALCRKLGFGWTPRVWENMGWHYSAISACGRWKVHPLGAGGGYHAFLGDKSSPGGFWVSDGRTPRAALRATWKIAAAAIAHWKSFESARHFVGAQKGR